MIVDIVRIPIYKIHRHDFVFTLTLPTLLWQAFDKRQISLYTRAQDTKTGPETNEQL